MIALPQRKRGFFYASTPDAYSSYKLIRACGVPKSPVSPYCSGIHVNGTEAQKKVVARIAEAKLSVLFLALSFELFVLAL